MILHAILEGLRAAAVALVLVAQPLSAWRWSGAVSARPSTFTLVAVLLLLLLPGAVATAIAHLWLVARRPLPADVSTKVYSRKVAPS
jgi:hypothetical protein